MVTLHDQPTNRTYDLTELVKQEGNELSIGRAKTNVIVLGTNSEGERITTRDEDLFKVSREHGTISYGPANGHFFLGDHSLNGSSIGDCKFHNNECMLSNGDILHFGSYGPVIFTED